MKLTILEQSCVRVKNKTICAIIAAITDGKVIIESSVSTFTGIAKCSPEDKFDKTIGHRLAFARAETKAFKFYSKKLRESTKVHTELIKDAEALCEKLNRQIAHNEDYITTFIEE